MALVLIRDTSWCWSAYAQASPHPPPLSTSVAFGRPRHPHRPSSAQRFCANLGKIYDFTSPSPAWFSYCFTKFYLVFVRVSFFHFFTHILFPFISPQLYLNLFPSCDSKTIFLYRPVKALCVRPLFRPILTAIGQHKRGETLGSDSVQFFRLSVSSNSAAAAAATISHTQYTHWGNNNLCALLHSRKNTHYYI